MKLITALCLAMWLTPLTPAAGQDSATATVSQIMTFSYPMDVSGTMHLSPTALLPQVKGTVEVDRGSVAIDVDVRVDHIPPSQNSGGDSNTYVVWLISPDGETQNVGELLLNGDSGTLQTITNWGSFGIFVTVEPNNCAICPSRYVVLATEVCVNGLGPGRPVTIVCPKSSNVCRRND
jgi:hypothetical protein